MIRVQWTGVIIRIFFIIALHLQQLLLRGSLLGEPVIPSPYKLTTKPV
jgi:hypothetical protein